MKVLRYVSIMPRSLILLVVLLALGLAGGILLRNNTDKATPSPNAAPGEIALLKKQVEYMQDQVTALTKENIRLSDQLAKARTGTMETVPASPPLPDDGDPDFNGIAIELLKTRGLQALPMACVAADRSDVEELIAKWLSERFPKDYGVNQGRALVALGAIPEPVDTLVMRAAFWSHQIGAWYDEEQETLFLAPSANEGRENALGLAFTHLFRENGAQLFPKDKGVNSTDKWLANMSLLAGDAAFTRLLHSVSHPKTGGGGGVGEDPDDPSRSMALPNFLREMELAPFGVGLDFVRGLHDAAKFDQVDAVYSRPPVSCLEVLEPEIYLAETQFKPALPNWTDTKVNGLTPLWDDSLGPIALVLLLKRYVPQPVAADTAPGWRGDRMVVYPAEGKSRDHVAWQTMWKDSNAADAFFSAMRQSLVSRYKDAVPDQNAPGGVFKLNGPARFVVLTRTHDGRGVFYADAADAEIADAMWNKLTQK